MRIGYACINLTLAEQKIQVNRTMVKKTFLSKGIPFASEVALKNVQDLAKLTDWNIKNGLLFYRMSSDMFPWMSEYEFSDLPDFQLIKKLLNKIGERIKEAGIRMTFHPGPFNVLATNNANVLKNTLKELRQHAEIMDMIGLPETVFSKINIHVGAAYGDKISALQRFSENFAALPVHVKARLVVENDDKENMFSVKDLLYLHEKINIPITFDFLHHSLCNGGLTEKEAFLLATETWPEGIPPVVHYSSSKKKYECATATEVAHADYIYQHINRYGKEVDIMLEAKAKEKATLRYMDEYKWKTVTYGK